MKSTSSPLRRGPAAPTISCVVVASYAYEASERRESDDAPGEEDGKKQSLLQTHTTWNARYTGRCRSQQVTVLCLHSSTQEPGAISWGVKRTRLPEHHENQHMPIINILFCNTSSCTHLEKEENAATVRIRRRAFPALGGSVRRASSIDFLPFRDLYRCLVLVLLQQLDVRYPCLGVYLLYLAPPARVAAIRGHTTCRQRDENVDVGSIEAGLSRVSPSYVPYSMQTDKDGRGDALCYLIS